MIRKNFYLPDKLIRDLEKKAKKEGVSLSELLRRVIKDYLENKK
jgi:metal-responsive CopG/Arc/MetJ family transcriptional regulator